MKDDCLEEVPAIEKKIDGLKLDQRQKPSELQKRLREPEFDSGKMINGSKEKRVKINDDPMQSRDSIPQQKMNGSF